MKPVECEAAEDVAPGLRGIISVEFPLFKDYHVVLRAQETPKFNFWQLKRYGCWSFNFAKNMKTHKKKNPLRINVK